MQKIKKHKVIKKLDQFSFLNPIQIDKKVIRATVNGRLRFGTLKELSSSLHGWDISIETINNTTVLIIKSDFDLHEYTHPLDAMRYYYFPADRFNNVFPKLRGTKNY